MQPAWAKGLGCSYAPPATAIRASCYCRPRLISTAAAHEGRPHWHGLVPSYRRRGLQRVAFHSIAQRPLLALQLSVLCCQNVGLVRQPVRCPISTCPLLLLQVACMFAGGLAGPALRDSPRALHHLCTCAPLAALHHAAPLRCSSGPWPLTPCTPATFEACITLRACARRCCRRGAAPYIHAAANAQQHTQRGAKQPHAP